MDETTQPPPAPPTAPTDASEAASVQVQETPMVQGEQSIVQPAVDMPITIWSAPTPLVPQPSVMPPLPASASPPQALRYYAIVESKFSFNHVRVYQTATIGEMVKLLAKVLSEDTVTIQVFQGQPLFISTPPRYLLVPGQAPRPLFSVLTDGDPEPDYDLCQPRPENFG